MPDEEQPKPTTADRIREELARNVISEPLYTDVLTDPAAVRDIIIDANVQYYKGRQAVFEAIIDLARRARQSAPKPTTAVTDDIRDPTSIGSDSNPYMRARLPGYLIQEMARIDAQQARAQAETAKADEQARRDSGQPAAAHLPPVDPGRYRAIYRMWRNFELNALIDKSVSTVKADAARRAFLAEGRDIVWAVIDSGIDKLHEHFKANDNLSVKAPVAHWDFTGPQGARVGDSALEDGLGHGTHIAGIIAGGVMNGCDPKPQALRTRLDPSQKIVEDPEPIETICGMAPCTRLVSMKVLDNAGRGDISRVIEAVDKIQEINDHGRQLLIHGVNLSLGYEFDPRWFACGQSPICVELDRLVRSGVVVVVAAGNTGYGTLASMQRQTGAGFMLTINDPGNAELAITVGSTHRDMPHTYGVSYFSSKGPTGDGRSKPDLVAPGERILSCASTRLASAAGRADFYREDSGTSQAAAHVSGVIAAFLSIRREYIGQPEQVKKIFVSTATDLSRERYSQGFGLIDLMRAIQSL